MCVCRLDVTMKGYMKESFEIADIIVAWMQGKASPRELERLDKWVEDGESNRKLLVELLNEDRFEARNKILESLNEEMAWRRLRNKVRRKMWMRVWAVAASLLLVFGGGWLFWLERKGNVASRQMIVDTYQEPERNKAFLTLSTGERIVVERRDTTIGETATMIQVKSSGVMSYGKGNSARSKEVQYNTLETPQGTEFQLELADGTKVWLNASSSLQYPVDFAGKERRVRLRGEAYFEVERDEEHLFVVETSRADVEVLGTKFGVRDYAGKENLTTLVSGRVAVAVEGGDRFVINPGQQVCVGSDGVVVRDVEPMLFVAWKDGYFAFNKTRLVDIMKELSDWYDVKCRFVDKRLEGLLLTARLKRYDDIDSVLDILARTGNLHFYREGRVIWIRK